MSLRSAVPLPAVAATAGLLAGAGGKLADLAYATPWGWLGVLGSGLAPWVLLTVALGRRSGGARTAAASGAVMLLSSLVGYYLAYALLDGRVDLLVVVFWVLAAVTAAPLLALAAHRTRRGGRLAGLLCAGPAGLLLAEALVQLTYPDPLSRWPLVVAGAGGCAALLVLLPADRSVRRHALAWLPVAVLAGAGLLRLPRLVVGVLLGGG